MPRISEQDAATITQAFPTLPVERQAEARRFLERYRDQQAEEGQPLFPSEFKRQEEAKTRLRTMFEDPAQVDTLVPEFRSFASLATDLDGLRAREANRHFLAARSGKSPADIGLDYEDMRAEYSAARYGEPIADDKAFFARAKAEVMREADHEAKRLAAYSAGAAEAMKGGNTYAKALAAIRAKGEDADTEGFGRGYYAIAERLGPYRRMIEDVAAQGKAMMTSPEGFDWGALAKRLLEVPKRDRKLVLQAIAQSEVAQEGGTTAGEMDAGIRLGVALDRGLEQFIDTAMTGGRSMMVNRARAALESIPTPPGMKPADMGEMDAQQADMREFLNLRDDLRDIINGEVNPVEDVRLLGANLSGVAENLPLTLSAFVPWAGPAAMVASFQRSTYNELRRQNPGMDEAAMQRIATLSAPFQALTEVVSDRLLFGRLPNLKRAFTSPALTASGIAKQFGARVAVGTAVETAEEFVQGVTPRAIQSLASALGQDVPEVDWNGYLSRFAKETPELLAIVIPMALIGAGVGQVSDYSAVQTMLSNEKLLKAAGYAEPGPIMEAANRGDMAETQRLMREQWKTVAPKGESPAEVANQAVATVNKEAQAKWEADVAEARAEVEKIAKSAEEVEAAIDYLARNQKRPVLARDSQGWYMEDRETAERIRFKDRESAVAAVFIGVDANERQNAEAMAQAWDEFYAMGGQRAEAVEISRENVTTENVDALGYATEAEAMRGAEAHAQLAGLDAAEAKGEVQAVLGLNRAEMAENVRTHVSRIFGGANVSTVLHEGIHGRVRQGLESGHYSAGQLLSWVRMAEQASGVSFLPSKDDASISPAVLEEAIVDVVVSDAIGRRKDGGHFSAGLISRGMAAQFRGQRAQAKESGRFRAFLEAWRAFWGQVLKRARQMGKARKEGKLTAEFDAVLDDLMGMESQARHEGAAIREAESALSDNVPFSLGRLVVSDGTPTLEASNATVVGPAAFSIMAHHGTPHKVDRFTLEKIGTGEGAQAYGWGLYFAGNKDVAKTYQRDLAQRAEAGDEWFLKPTDAGKQRFNDLINFADAAPMLASQSLRGVQSVDAPAVLRRLAGLVTRPDYKQAYLGFADMLEEGTLAFEIPKGNLYTVELNVEEDDLLDWDMPLSEQSEGVQLAWGDFLKSDLAKNSDRNMHGDLFKKKGQFSNPRGQDFMGALSEGVPYESGPSHQVKYQKQLNEFLLARGIKGIRYLDGQSRDGGEGTYNYVVFDESLITIKQENGKPVEMAAAFSLQRNALGTRLSDLMPEKPSGETADLVTAYAKARQGSGTAFVSVDDVWQAAKEQNPKLNLADFRRDMRAMVDRGEAFMEPSEGPRDTAEAGVPLSNGMTGVRVAMIPQSEVSFSMAALKYGGFPAKENDRIEVNGIKGTIFEVSENINGSGYWTTLYDVVAPDGTNQPPFALAIDSYVASFRVIKRNGGRTAISDEERKDLETFRQTKSKTSPGLSPLSGEPLEYGGKVTYQKPKRIGPRAGNIKVGDWIFFGVKASEVTEVREEGSDVWLSFGENSMRIRKDIQLKRGKPGQTLFQLAPRSLASYADTILATRINSKPELKEALFRVARQRLAGLMSSQGWRGGAESQAERNRTIASLNRERMWRKRSRERELLAEIPGKVEDWVMLAYEAGVENLEDHPFVVAMLGNHGKLLSANEASRQGRYDPLLHGDYDGAPVLPPMFWGKGTAGIMPDVMAQSLYEDGALNEPTTDALWSELEKVINGHRTAKTKFAEARKAIRELEAEARKQAKEESDAWFADAKAAIPTAKEKQMMALRTLDAILSAFPPEVRGRVGGFVKLAGLSTDKAREKEIAARIEKLGKEVERFARGYYREKIRKLFKQAEPEMKSGKKAKGKLGPDGHYLLNAAKSAMDLNEDETNERVGGLQMRIAKGEMSADQEVLAMMEAELVQLFGDFKNKDSAQLEAAFDAANRVYTQAFMDWKIREIAKRERRKEKRQNLKAATGKAGVRKERVKQEESSMNLLGLAQRFMLNVSSLAEVMNYAFGKSDVAAEILEQERQAAYQYEDAIQSQAEELQDFFTELAGGSVLAGERLRFDLSQRSFDTAQGGRMSEMEGIQALLMWQQEDGKRHMDGTRDENGKITSDWHYDESFIAEIESNLSDNGRAVLQWLREKYAAEWSTLNPLYRQRHGVNLPKNDVYAPITVKPVMESKTDVVDPTTGVSMTGGGILSPGSLRTRSRSAIAEPDFRDALQVFLAHTKQLEWWKAYYDFAVEAQAVLGSRDVQNAVKAAGGEETSKALARFVEIFAQGGMRDAAAGLAVTETARRMTSRAATVGLLGRVSTLLVQSTQLAAASVKMPVGAYLKRFSMLLTGQMQWGEAMRSDFIQRRIKQAPPIVRQAMEGLGQAKRPDQITRAVRNLGQLLSGADGLFTAGTYAMLLDWHRSQGAKLGLTGQELTDYAHAEATRDTEAVAQPTRMATRSLAELTMTNPIARISWAYASEARQKLALAAWGAKNLGKDPVYAAKTAFLTFVVGGLMSQVLKNLWRELKGDDDESKWSAERLALATLGNALHGVPLASAISGDSGMLSSFQWAPSAMKRMVEMDYDSPSEVLRDVDTLLSAAGLFNETAAGISTLSHAGVDAAKLLENASGD